MLLTAFATSVNVKKAQAPEIEAWLDGLERSAAARYNAVSMLACFYDWMVDEGTRKDNPVQKVVRPKLPIHLPRPISSDGLALAISQATPRMAVWLCLAAYCGLRVCEISGLKVSDIRLADSPPTLHLTKTKGSRDRVVPLNPLVVAALVDYGLAPSGSVFSSYYKGSGRRRPLLAATISQQIADYLRELGVDATAHQLRHWFATELYRKTGDLRLVQELLGHADVSTTARYVKIVPSEQATAAVTSLSAAPVLSVAS